MVHTVWPICCKFLGALALNDVIGAAMCMTFKHTVSVLAGESLILYGAYRRLQDGVPLLPRHRRLLARHLIRIPEVFSQRKEPFFRRGLAGVVHMARRVCADAHLEI